MRNVGRRSDKINRGDDTADEHDRADRDPKSQPFFDDDAGLRAVAVEQKCQEKKSARRAQGTDRPMNIGRL